MSADTRLGDGLLLWTRSRTTETGPLRWGLVLRAGSTQLRRTFTRALDRRLAQSADARLAKAKAQSIIGGETVGIDGTHRLYFLAFVGGYATGIGTRCGLALLVVLMTNARLISARLVPGRAHEHESIGVLVLVDLVATMSSANKLTGRRVNWSILWAKQAKVWGRL